MEIFISQNASRKKIIKYFKKEQMLVISEPGCCRGICIKKGRKTGHISITVLIYRKKTDIKFCFLPIQEKRGLNKTQNHRHRDSQNLLICKAGRTNEIKKTLKGQYLEMRIYFF